VVALRSSESGTMGERVRVALTNEVPAGAGREFTVGDRVIALFNVDGKFHALDGICPHSGGPLGKGPLRGNVVTCPWHGWQFDVTTGRHCFAPRIQQPCLPVEVIGDEVFVTLDE
jgi:nitrite reductase (NADH) small subunit